MQLIKYGKDGLEIVLLSKNIICSDITLHSKMAKQAQQQHL